MTNNIDRAAEVIGQLTGDGELGRNAAQGIAQYLADEGCLMPDLSNVTRITVAGDGKRQMEEWNLHDVELHIQDEGRTLKIFYRTNIQDKRSRTATDHAEGVGRADA